LSAIEYIYNSINGRINVNPRSCYINLQPKKILVSKNALILADLGLLRLYVPFEDDEYIDGAPYYLTLECKDSNTFKDLVVYYSSDI
jgi:hypothetical protein